MKNPLRYLFNAIRTAVFTILSTSCLIIVSFFSILTLPCSINTRYFVATRWCWATIFLAKWICGINYNVIGKQTIPSEVCVIVSNHQSTWETLFFPLILPKQTWVIKKELLWIPLFGQLILSFHPISVDRKNKHKTKYLLSQSVKRLKEGFSVVIFPEGTRVIHPNKSFSKTAAKLAIEAGVPILPIAHDAGKCWPKDSFIKTSGTINITIGKPINTIGKNAVDLTREVETWIKQTVKEY